MSGHGAADLACSRVHEITFVLVELDEDSTWSIALNGEAATSVLSIAFCLADV